MRRVFVTGVAFAVLAAAGCASILGIPDRSLAWCLRPENTHAFCEDFDHPNPTQDWSFAPPPATGTTRTLVSSSFDPPNALALDTDVGSLMTGASAFSGLQQAFTSEVFNQVVVGVDIRIVSFDFMMDIANPTLETGAGFLLLSDVVTQSAMGPSECIGLALAPAGVGQVGIDVVLVPNSSDCLTVNNLVSGSDAGALADADAPAPTAATTPIPSPLASVFLNQWFRLTLTVTRQSDGSGTIDFRVPAGSSMAPPPIPAGSLSQGYPSLAIGTDVTGPSGTIEIQFDNVTVDFLPAN